MALISVIVVVLTALVAAGVWATGSLWMAIAIIPLALAIAVLFETFTVTLFLHRRLTHGSWDTAKRWLDRILLWLARSGGVKYWQWVENHTWHHYFADTDQDSYTPWETNVLTKQPPLPKHLRPWNFWRNGQSYRRFSDWVVAERHSGHDPIVWLATQDEPTARVVPRLKTLEAYRVTYSNIGRGALIDLLLFEIVALPLTTRLGGLAWLLIPIVLAPAAFGLKYVAYLCGGQIINAYGHRRTVAPHQANIPWCWMVVTLFMLGEGWHEFHHHAPWSARFHRNLDPGWWLICVFRSLGWIKPDSVVVAEPTGQPHDYRSVMAT